MKKKITSCIIVLINLNNCLLRFNIFKYKGVQNHGSILKPVLSRNAYDFNDDCDGEKCISTYSSPAAHLKE